MKKLLLIVLLMNVVRLVYGAFPDEYPLYLQLLGFTKEEIRHAQSGALIQHSLKNKLPGEYGVTVAKLILAPPYYFRDYYTAIESYKSREKFQQVGKFKPSPDLQDLEALHLEPQELKDLLACRPQNCGLKLSAAEISMIPQDAEQVADTFRKILLDRLLAYQKNGISGIAAYEDADQPGESAKMIPLQLMRFPQLDGYFPQAMKYLVEYPNHKNRLTSEFFYWSKESWGKKPVITLRHVFSQGVGEDFVIINNLIYSSHYFVSSIGVLHLINYADGGSTSTLLVGQERTLTDLKGNFFVAIGRDFIGHDLERRLISSLQLAAESTETRYGSNRLYVGFPYELQPTDQR